MVVFLDTYAIIEIDRGNAAYRAYDLEIDTALTSPLNLIEVYYTFLRMHDTRKADEMFHKVRAFTSQVSPEVIKAGCRFKLEHSKKKLSYTDCIGYLFARKAGIPFVTGDKEFKHFPGVEFIK